MAPRERHDPPGFDNSRSRLPTLPRCSNRKRIGEELLCPEHKTAHLGLLACIRVLREIRLQQNWRDREVEPLPLRWRWYIKSMALPTLVLADLVAQDALVSSRRGWIPTPPNLELRVRSGLDPATPGALDCHNEVWQDATVHRFEPVTQWPDQDRLEREQVQIVRDRRHFARAGFGDRDWHPACRTGRRGTEGLVAGLRRGTEDKPCGFG
jgi:hypothetical protein